MQITLTLRGFFFFFSFTRKKNKKQKNKSKACSCFQSTEVIQRCCKNRVFCSLPEPTLLLSTAPWSGLSHVYHVLIGHLFFISQRLCGQKANFTFSLCQPKQQPTMSEKKKKKKAKKKLATLYLSSHSMNSKIIESGKNLYNDSVVCLIKFTFSWIKNQNIVIVVFCLPFKLKI